MGTPYSFNPMYNIIYSSEADRNRLQVLQELLPLAQTEYEQSKILQEIEEIKGRQKPLHECTLEECTELRTTIYSKFEKLTRIGKTGHAIGFKRMMGEIERRMATIQMEMTKEELERKKTKVETKPEQQGKDETSKRKSPARTGSSRWTTGVGKLD